MKKFAGLLVLAAACLVATPVVTKADAKAQSLSETGLASGSNTGKEPIEITAGRTMEWRRTEQQYIARGEALARQGDMSITGETLTADYHEGEKSGMEIWKLTAEEGVRVQSGENSAYGDKAVYEVDKGLAVMTGSNLRLVSPEQTVTARDRLEYWTEKGEANAIGDAKVVRGEDTLTADTLKATFKENAQGKRALDTLEAVGNVVIITPEEKLTGKHGIYHAATNVAELKGDVRIERGPNILEGERAEVDLTSNVSKIFGAPENGGRVRGIFYPGSEKTKEAPPSFPLKQ